MIKLIISAWLCFLFFVLPLCVSHVQSVLTRYAKLKPSFLCTWFLYRSADMEGTVWVARRGVYSVGEKEDNVMLAKMVAIRCHIGVQLCTWSY